MPDKSDLFPNGGQAVVLVMILFGIEYVLTGVMMYDLRNWLGLSTTQIWAMVTLLGNGCLFTAIMHLRRLNYGPLFHAAKASPTATLSLLSLPVLSLVPALILMMGVVGDVMTWLFPVSDTDAAMFAEMGNNSLASILAATVLAPVLEEMLFRGLILRSFLRQYPRWYAIAGSAVIFGVAHMNVYQFAVASLLGLLLGWLYERSKSLIPCITLHAVYNGVLTWMDWNASFGKTATDAAMAGNTDGAGITGWLLALLLAAGGLRILQRLLVR